MGSIVSFTEYKAIALTEYPRLCNELLEMTRSAIQDPSLAHTTITCVMF